MGCRGGVEELPMWVGGWAILKENLRTCDLKSVQLKKYERRKIHQIFQYCEPHKMIIYIINSQVKKRK